jgi:hypothetical protein
MTAGTLPSEHGRLDFAGTITATGGLVAAAQLWGSARVLLPLLGGFGLLA